MVKLKSRNRYLLLSFDKFDTVKHFLRAYVMKLFFGVNI